MTCYGTFAVAIGVVLIITIIILFYKLNDPRSFETFYADEGLPTGCKNCRKAGEPGLFVCDCLGKDGKFYSTYRTISRPKNNLAKAFGCKACRKAGEPGLFVCECLSKDGKVYNVYRSAKRT